MNTVFYVSTGNKLTLKQKSLFKVSVYIVSHTGIY